MHDARFHRPATIPEAVAALRAASDGKILAGGQSLIPVMKLRLAQLSDLVSIAKIETLRGIAVEGNDLVIGAMTTHAEVETSDVAKKKIPSLSRLAAGIGDPQVRNRGTLGGSLAHADPAADYAAAALALGATIETDRRKIAADDFFRGFFETALEKDEVILKVRFPTPTKAAYAKFIQPASRFAIVGVMVARTASGVRVGVTGAGPKPTRNAAMEAALTKDFSAKALESIAVPSTDLTHDLHASAEYRAHLVGVMARRAVADCA